MQLLLLTPKQMNETTKRYEDTTILKVLVGSRAHGLHNDASDYDFRGVFVTPTHKILSLDPGTKNTQWIEGDVDNTSWEIGHFLRLAVRCNPTILETFLAPVENSTPIGDELRSLFPYTWNSHGVRDAFVGYGLNQRKKFLEAKDGRPEKFAVAYARTLIQAYELLTTGTFTIRISETEHGPMLIKWKHGNFTYGEVIQFCKEWEERVREAYIYSPPKETNMQVINSFLLKVRHQYFTI